MRVRKFCQCDNGLIFFEPVGPWYGAYHIVDGERLGLASNYLWNNPSHLIDEGEQCDVERGDGGAAPHVDQRTISDSVGSIGGRA